MAFLPTTKTAPVTLIKSAPLQDEQKYPLLLTKFTPPRPPEIGLSRERLLKRLAPAETTALTLICAAAGSGKTTLLTQWYHECQRQNHAIAWLSLESSDNTPQRFSRYLLTALRPLYQGLSSIFDDIQEEEHPGDFLLFLTKLINQLHHCPHPLYLILDDYQNIHHPDIHQGVDYLLNHAPGCLHLLISSRYRPPIGLGRLQIAEQLIEIDDNELRFTADEATHYFSSALSTPLHKWDIQQVLTATEGWIAGMKIATLPLYPHSGTGRLVRNINSGSRILTRYLEEIVFSPLPADVHVFLMQTSILTRLHPTLCNAVTGKNNGAEMLAWIEQNNLFLSALDENRTWFRYQPLMRDALIRRLQQSAPDIIHQLHERAGHWFAAQQQWAEAIRHGLASGQAAPLHAEASAQSLAEEGDIETMVRWMHSLPAHLDSSRVELQLNLAWALAHRFHFNQARQLLDAIENKLTDSREYLQHSTHVKLRVVRGICEAFAGNIPGSIEIVEPLLQEIPCGDIWVDGLVCNILSYCHLAALRPQQALDVQRRIVGNREDNRNLFVKVYRTFVVAQGHFRQADLQRAQQLASQALEDAEPCPGANTSSGATLAPLLAAIAWEQGKTEKIDELLRSRLQMIDNFAPAEGLSDCYISLARQAVLKGQISEAESWLDHAEQLATQREWSGALAPLLAERVRLSLQSGNIAKAHQLLNPLQELTRQYNSTKNRRMVWYHDLSRSRLLLANNQPRAAVEYLSALMTEQELCGEWLSALHSRLLLTTALWRMGETDRAINVCKPALQQILSQNLLRSLMDADAELLLVINYLRKQQDSDNEFSHVIDPLWSILRVTKTGFEKVDTPASYLKLTEREQQILQLIAEGYPNKTIARTMGISAETVKWHLKHLYEKLEASNRTQAVNQARKWHLLS
ncbi:LuxR C-terminal-related transcriptional regulator [Klebsiella sp. BIGb0407]|uniref:LuxR C-terminal-related transcriptional regulator n=1 Tax=Klebsiella sp. BIGb0407 TaxID=2940603 RepID=UPI0021695106|nr:LuxR C-terminal-related transcriptional regulator [Klebsiella sp. BIGb0407]MCS3432440.1 LuxR family maltose regulon positive regulatory protein [Klebsiella sp. BIGb0407]